MVGELTVTIMYYSTCAVLHCVQPIQCVILLSIIIFLVFCQNGNVFCKHTLPSYAIKYVVIESVVMRMN